MNIIVIGSGGREHAIAWALSKSECVEKIIVVPGNGGTAHEAKCKNISIDECTYIHGNENPFVQIAKNENCSLAVIGPEDPLADGISDLFWEAGIACVGPKKKAALLEASKDFAKQFMKKYGVACAESETFTDEKAALAFAKKKGAPLVIKADGLAAGKGVIVALTLEEAKNAIHLLMSEKKVGSAGEKIVIEEYLRGTEISMLSSVSVTSEKKSSCIKTFLPARDHKRLLDGAKGANTGGMGSVSPLSDVDDATLLLFQKNIVEPTLRGLKAEDFDYRGFLFFGVMLTKDGPKLLEYNVRLGDPETQAVLPLCDFDFCKLCEAIADGTLQDFQLKWKDGFVVAPVMVSGGYPEAYEKNKKITIDKNRVHENVKIFVAGAKEKNGELFTSGGRVLAVSCFGKNFEEAWNGAYESINAISFEKAFYRRDIGLKGAAESN